MISTLFRDVSKKLKYTYSFLKKDMVHLNLQILYECNFKCRICDFWKPPYTDYPKLSVKQVSIIEEKIRKLGPQIISIGGGEPLLHPDIYEISSILAKNNFLVMICNGWFMTPEIARKLWESGFYEISISLDYVSPEKHDRQRGVKGAFYRAVNALKMLHENRVYPNQRVNMISVVMDDNLDDIEPLINLSKEIGITYLVTFYSTNRGKKKKQTAVPDISKFLLDLKRRYRNFASLRGYLGGFTEASGNENGIQPCLAGKNLFNIDSQGNATLCIDTLDKPAGNVLTEDIIDIKKRLYSQFENNKCGDCWTSCRGPIETAMYGKNRIANLRDYYQLTRDISLNKKY